MPATTDEAPDLNTATVSLTAFTPFIRLLEEAGQDAITHAAERAKDTCARWGVPFAELEFDPTLSKARDEAIELHRQKGQHDAVERLLNQQLDHEPVG